MNNKQLSNMTIITKDDCRWCVLAKELLKKNNIPFKELYIPVSLTREEFLTLAEEHDTKPTVPKVFVGKTLIGGYEELVEYLK
jgi:glutaredoxin 3